jgi:hypothetical protein
VVHPQPEAAPCRGDKRPSEHLMFNEVYIEVCTVLLFKLVFRCICLIAKFIDSFNLKRPPLWSSGQGSWLHPDPWFDSRHYQKKSSGSGTESTQPREYN